jgi:5-(aminomethyl)-3-furanmethanol phosphate kinase
MTLTVVKIGGSLFDLPDLATRLRSWLATLDAGRILLVAGGGATADVIREFDRIHGLGEETAHDLALCSLTLNARFLGKLLGPSVPVLNPERGNAWQGVALLDAHAFCQREESARELPACWDATSDSVAAYVAIALGAAELILLKSTDAGEVRNWSEASRSGLVDPLFHEIIAGSTLLVRMVNLRRWAIR